MKNYSKCNLIYRTKVRYNQTIVGLKELRENTDAYINAVERGKSFVVVRKSKPVFKISSPAEADELWEQVIDFTKIKKGGIKLDQLLARL